MWIRGGIDDDDLMRRKLGGLLYSMVEKLRGVLRLPLVTTA